jgi:hypothetical protein
MVITQANTHTAPKRLTEANVGTAPKIPAEAKNETAPIATTQANAHTAPTPSTKTKESTAPIVPTEAKGETAPRVITQAKPATAPRKLTQANDLTAPLLVWGDVQALRTCGEALADAIKARISVENRVRRGGTAFELQGTPLCEGARHLEASFRSQLTDVYRQVVPAEIRDWAAGIPGLATGELFPRIIACIGDPRFATPYTWEDGAKAPTLAGPVYQRTLRLLWGYAGLGDPRRTPRADILGHSPSRAELLAGGKRTQLRPLLYTFTSYLLRAHTRSDAVANSRYWKVFEMAKAEAATSVHQHQCQNKKRPPMSPNGCGTVLHPEWGAPGSVWRPGHALMHAHRITQKEFLRDLWIVAGGPAGDRDATVRSRFESVGK